MERRASIEIFLIQSKQPTSIVVDFSQAATYVCTDSFNLWLAGLSFFKKKINVWALDEVYYRVEVVTDRYDVPWFTVDEDKRTYTVLVSVPRITSNHLPDSICCYFSNCNVGDRSTREGLYSFDTRSYP